VNHAFLDTGYVLALELVNDQNHQAAANHWSEIGRALPQLVTTSLVFAEIVTFFNNRGLHTKAVQVDTRLAESPSVDVVQVDGLLFQEAWAYFCRRQDKTYSLADCASFVVMQRREIDVALTFDRHFVQAGFAMRP
jgi:predicted nucleic acid-binding protein